MTENTNDAVEPESTDEGDTQNTNASPPIDAGVDLVPNDPEADAVEPAHEGNYDDDTDGTPDFNAEERDEA